MAKRAAVKSGGDDRVKVTVRLPRELVRRGTIYAVERDLGRGIQAFLEHAARQALAKVGR
jgi:hypothetical protein